MKKKKFKQPSPYIEGQVYNFEPIIFRIGKNEYSVFSFTFRERHKRPVSVFVTQELRIRLISEMKERDIAELKLDKIPFQYCKNSYKLRDFKVYREDTSN